MKSLIAAALMTTTLLSGSAFAEEPPVEPKAIVKPKAKSGEVTVRLRSSDPRAVLERRAASADSWSDEWQAICVAPCQATVDYHDGLRVGGSGIEPMHFMADAPGTYDVDAVTGAGWQETAGLTLVLGGVTFLVLGGIGVGIAESQDWSWSDEADEAGPIAMTMSLTGIGIGAVMMGIGAALRFSSISGELDIRKVQVKVSDGVTIGPGGISF
jgi:hypothetical protein